MINIKKVSDEKYIAVIDLVTFESYGLSVSNVLEEENYDNVDNLLIDIMHKISLEYKDTLGEYCDVNILVEHEIVIITLKIGSDDSVFENDNDEDGFESIENFVEKITNDSTSSTNSINANNLLDFIEENINLNDSKLSKESLITDDYSDGLIVEFKDIESFIKLLIPLSNVISEEEKISLYYNNFDDTYYLLLNKTGKLSNLFSKYTSDIRDEEIRLEVEYELAEDIFMEYNKIKSFFIERGFKSTKNYNYLEEFCDIIYDSNSIQNLSNIFN